MGFLKFSATAHARESDRASRCAKNSCGPLYAICKGLVPRPERYTGERGDFADLFFGESQVTTKKDTIHELPDRSRMLTRRRLL
jgi:hypothetical protein